MVVLPQPEGPRRVRNSPLLILRSMPSSARVSSKDLSTPLNSMILSCPVILPDCLRILVWKGARPRTGSPHIGHSRLRSSFSADSCEKAFSGLSGRPSRTPEGCLRTFSFTHPLHEAGQRVKKSPIHDFTANLLFLKILSKHALSFFPQVPKKRLSFILVRAKKGFFTGCGSVW